MYTSCTSSCSSSLSAEVTDFPPSSSNPIPWHDPSPFGYLLETSSFIPTSTATPVYQYPGQTAEFNAPPLQFDVLYQSLAPPASFDHQFHNASATQSTFPFSQPEIGFQSTVIESITPTRSLYRFIDSSPSLQTPLTSNVHNSAEYSLPLTTLPVSSAPSTSTPLVPTQPIQPQKEKNKSTSSSTSKPTATSSSKTYPCDLCDKIFHRAYNLKSHQLSHSKARPYECRFDECPWRFSRPHDLRRHEQLHAGHRPFGCSTCGKRFAQLEALQRHARGDTICLRIATMLAHAASITETPTSKNQ